MKAPSVVSISDMFAAKMSGSEITARNCTPFAAAPAEIASSATSDAVSKPRPNRKPIGYMCQLVETTRNRRPKTRVISPPATSSSRREPRSYSPRRIRR